jgi:hypothetical protein
MGVFPSKDAPRGLVLTMQVLYLLSYVGVAPDPSRSLGPGAV